MAISDDGQTIVIACNTSSNEKVEREDKLEFWNAAGNYATAIIPLPHPLKTIDGIPPLTFVTIDGDKAVVTNEFYCFPTRQFLGMGLVTSRHWNTYCFEFALADGKLLKSETVPDRTERELCLWGHRYKLENVLACAATILCMLVGGTVFFLIRRAPAAA